MDWRVLVFATALTAMAQAPDAREYDRLIGRWNRQLAPELIRFAGFADGAKILDYSCGTGALALRAAARLPHSEILGVDLAQEYVAFATLQAPRSTLRFRKVDDLFQLPFPNGEFDGAMTLAISAVNEPNRAVAEMRRVSKPETVVAAATFDYGNTMQALQLFWDTAGVPNPEANSPLASKGALEALWKEAQLRDIEEQSVEIRLNFRDFADYWSLFTAGRGAAGEWLEKLPEDKRASFQENLRAKIFGARKDGPFTLGARAWMVKGVVRYY